MDEERKMNAIEDDELDAVAGGGTYDKNGFLKTTNGYACEHYECRCGYKGNPNGYHTCKPMSEEAWAYFQAVRTIPTLDNKCKNCKWHTTLRCNNPLNKK